MTVADEKAKKEEQERKKLEEAQRKVQKEVAESREKAEKAEAESKARAKREYEAKMAADKADAAKREHEKEAKFQAAAKAARDEKAAEKAKAEREKEASKKEKDGKSSGADGDESEMTEEEKASAAAMKALRNTSVASGMTEMERKEVHRPTGRPEGQPSRHEFVTEPAAMVLMFNCHRCGFKLSKGDITTMPESETVELRSVKSLVSVGRCKIAPSKGTEFIDRVEFPNEWRVGDVHGLVHDGLQGDGSLELRIDWKVVPRVLHS